MVSTTSLEGRRENHSLNQLYVRFTDDIVTSDSVVFLPVDPPRPFLRLDVDIVVIDINLGNLHLEVVGKEPDGFPHRAEAGTTWRLEERGWGRGPWKKENGGKTLKKTLNFLLILVHTSTNKKTKLYIRLLFILY